MLPGPSLLSQRQDRVANEKAPFNMVHLTSQGRNHHPSSRGQCEGNVASSSGHCCPPYPKPGPDLPGKTRNRVKVCSLQPHCSLGTTIMPSRVQVMPCRAQSQPDARCNCHLGTTPPPPPHKINSCSKYPIFFFIYERDAISPPFKIYFLFFW